MEDWKSSGQQAWNNLASDDASWAVLTNREKNDREMRSFFISGQRDVSDVLEEIKRLHITIDTDRALDYGCGIGRLTQALGQQFSEVLGVDVSTEMLTKARAFNQKEHIRFQTTADFFETDLDFSFVLSLITLQHIDPDHARVILGHLCNRLSPGGVMIIQIPEKPLGMEAIYQAVKGSPARGLLQVYSRLKGFIFGAAKERSKRAMHMYGMSCDTVQTICADADVRIVQRVEDDKAGKNWKSYTYFVQKEKQVLERSI